jgi:large subunit ribosomal protein L25
MKFTAFERSKQGTGASRRLRIAGKTPGIVYGAGQAPVQIELDHNALWHSVKKEAFHSSVLEMELGGALTKVLLRDVQFHPYKQLILHVDFQRVDENAALHTKVPLHFKGEENSDAVKLHGCLVNHILAELEVSCLPADLPEFIEIDLSGLQKGQSVHVSQINLPKGVKVLTHGQDDPVVASASVPAAEESEGESNAQ